jgi:hypothetical protein
VRTTLEDPILEAWEATRAKNRDRAAILDAQGRVLRTFSEIEESARHFATQLEAIPPARVARFKLATIPIGRRYFWHACGSNLSFCRWNRRLAVSKNKAHFRSAM